MLVVPVPGCVVGVVCPIPGLGATVPVFCAQAMLAANANTDDANKIFRIKACSLSEVAAAALSMTARAKDVSFVQPFLVTMRLAP